MTLPIESPASLKLPLNVPYKHLMGPGPTNCSPRVLRAMSLPLISPMHRECFQLMDELKEALRYAFQTRNNLTLVISASGTGAVEASMCNLIQPGEVVLIAVNGMWSIRAADFAERYGAQVIQLKKPLGECFNLQEVEEYLKKHKPILFAITLGESSTGVLQPMEGFGELCHKYNCLLVVDAVVSLAAVPVYTDRWGVDVIVAGTQKGLAAPPGLAPISVSPRALAKIESRKVPVAVYYWDIIALGQYWGCFGEHRPYHHTCAVNLLYALREALAILAEEGLEMSWARHKACSEQLHEGLKKLGVNFFVKDESIRLPSVTTICLPNFDWKIVSDYAMEKYNMELSDGTGPTKGKVLRIGTLGYNAKPDAIDFILKVLKEALEYAGHK